MTERLVFLSGHVLLYSSLSPSPRLPRNSLVSELKLKCRDVNYTVFKKLSSPRMSTIKKGATVHLL